MLLPVFVPTLVICFHPFEVSQSMQGFIIRDKDNIVMLFILPSLYGI